MRCKTYYVIITQFAYDVKSRKPEKYSGTVRAINIANAWYVARDLVQYIRNYQHDDKDIERGLK